MAFKDRLRETRLAKGLKQKDLADKIGGITGNTISNYEQGVSSPSVEIMNKLFDILEVTPNYMFQDYFNSEYNEKLSISELSLIKKYRELDSSGKEIINYIVEKESNRKEKGTEETPIKNKRIIPLSDFSLSAGTGNLLLDNTYEMIEIDGDEYPNADMAFRVKGDSMEPGYYDGDIVYIHRQPVVEPGEIGAFLYNDEQYLKKIVQEDGFYKLRSLNKKYEDIIIDNDSLMAYGKVLN